jgi:hypothetical protein
MEVQVSEFEQGDLVDAPGPADAGELPPPPPATHLPDPEPQPEPDPTPVPEPEPVEAEEPQPTEYLRASLVRYAIGKPGEHPRVFLSTGYEQDAVLQLLADEVYFAAPDLPPEPYSISPDGKSLVATEWPLDKLKADRRRDARAVRDRLQSGGCMTPLGRVDTDTEKSMPLIQGAASGAGISLALGLPYPAKIWTMADNSEVPHTPVQLVAMGMAVTAFVDACQQAYTAVKEKIDAAADAAALAAVDLTAGYPNAD